MTAVMYTTTNTNVFVFFPVLLRSPVVFFCHFYLVALLDVCLDVTLSNLYVFPVLLVLFIGASPVIGFFIDGSFFFSMSFISCLWWAAWLVSNIYFRVRRQKPTGSVLVFPP